MNNFYDPIVAEVRKNRAKLLEMYGGIEGLNSHLEDERPRLEKKGWHFATPEELAALKQHHSDGRSIGSYLVTRWSNV